jgi:sugar/nucleoside kinase (ribokinase family)
VADTIEVMGGGMAANVAVALARLGRSPLLMAALGSDEAADQMLRDLTAEGVDVSRVVQRAAAPSTEVILLVDRHLRRGGIFVRPQTLLSLRAEELDHRLIAEAPVLFIDLEPAAAALAAAATARRAGRRVVVDVQAGTPESAILGIDQGVVERAAALCDLLLPSREGLLTLTGSSSIAGALDAICAEFPGLTVAVTLGAEGSVLAQNSRRVRVPAYEVDVADTTGAGDVYHAALIETLYFQEWSLERAGHFASAAAALSCTAVGARAAAPTFEAVEWLLDRQRQDLRVEET